MSCGNDDATDAPAIVYGGGATGGKAHRILCMDLARLDMLVIALGGTIVGPDIEFIIDARRKFDVPEFVDYHLPKQSVPALSPVRMAAVNAERLRVTRTPRPAPKQYKILQPRRA